MTIVIGIIKEKFSVVATDTRIKLLEPIDKPYEDKYMKIYETSYSWVAGVGFGRIMTSFANKTKEDNITSLDEMRAIYKTVCMEIEGEYEGVKVEDTILVLSYSYKGDNSPQLQIETMSLNSENVYIFGCNQMFILFPTGLSEDDIGEIYSRFKPLIEGTDNLNELIYQISDCIDQVSSINDNISDICEFGLMFNAENILVSKKYLRGKAEDIKEICRTNNIEAHLQERNPILYV